jgi:MFS family permease
MPAPEPEARPRPPRPALPEPSPAAPWLVLLVLSLPAFASSYLYDCIGPLAKLLSAQLGYSNADIGLLQAVCSLPNLVMVLLGGILVDRIGERRSLTLFAALCLAGAAVTALSPRLGVMVGGRLLYGLGGGSLGVAINTGIAKWFHGRRLSFAFGLSLTISRLGSLAAQTSPAWARAAYGGWRGPLLMAILAGALCLAAAAAYGLFEPQAEPVREPGASAGFSPMVLRGFGRSYWLVVLLCVAFYAGIFPFQTFAQKIFIEARGATPSRASLLMGIPTVIAMVATPLFGLLADRIGQRTRLMLLGTALLAPCYLLTGYGRLPLALPMTLMGVAFALVPAVMWPAVMLIVPHRRLGTAFGLMSLIQSAGLSVFNILVGWANDWARAGEANPAGYRPGMWLFTGAMALALLFAAQLVRHEGGPGGHGLDGSAVPSKKAQKSLAGT